LGIVPSYSRPRVSDDNPYSEALIRTVKHHPDYPVAAFGGLDEASGLGRSILDAVQRGASTQAIQFVTPAKRHAGEHGQILVERKEA
jgi:hypothetical protein